MTRALAHRGPDDAGVHVEGTVGLAHTRLSIIDLSPAGHQPMVGRDAVISYNGEIFNHLALRQKLGGEWRGSSDTETLLRALETWGQAALPRLNGQFAFALLDRRGNRLLLGRDAFGIKPLYYVRQDDELIFSSEIKGLIAAGYRPVADPLALRHALAMSWVGGDATPLAGLRRVPPGTLLEFRLDDLSVREHEYYHPAGVVSADRMEMLAAQSAERNLQLVEDTLRTAVQRQLLADVPVGTMLSGGVDSSLLTALAVESDPNLQAFNASVVDGMGVDEGPFAEQVARHLGITLHQVRINAETWSESVVRAVQHYEYPLTHEASVPLAYIAGLARRHGVKVLLQGEGADELFGGYPWLHRPDWALWYARHHPLERIRREVEGLLVRHGWRKDPQPEPRVGPSADINAWEGANLARCEAAYAAHGQVRRRLEAKLLDEIHVYLQQILCRGDKNVMQWSVEGRVPFLDMDLVELAVNLPLEQKIEPRRKEPLRALSDRLLPPVVSARPKVGFQFDSSKYFSAAKRAFLHDGRLREILAAPAAAWGARIAKARHRQGILLWTAEIWCRLFLDGSSVESVQRELW